MCSMRRREFLSEAGLGALAACLGPALLSDLGIGQCQAAESAGRIDLGQFERLAGIMEDTPLDQLMTVLAGEVRSGTTAAQLVAAGALANARSLGGQDYIGYHTLMALAPAYAIAGTNPRGSDFVPIFKVLHRNTKQIQESAPDDDAMHAMAPPDASGTPLDAEGLRGVIRSADMDAAERGFAVIVEQSPEQAFNDLQLAIQDDINVHRVVLVWRAWALLPLTGLEHAKTMLRQSVRFCVDAEQHRIENKHPEPSIRQAVPRLIDTYKLMGIKLGDRRLDDAQLKKLADAIHLGSRDEGAEAAAAMLAEGYSPESVGEAISVAANSLLLHDPGRLAQWASEAKPAGSVHGDSVGVHASDAANAWRNIARVGNPRTTITSLVAGAYHTAGQKRSMPEPYPMAADLEAVSAISAEQLPSELDAAVQAKDQRRAAALAKKWGDAGLPAAALFERLRRYAISEDGALHAEKYFQTTTEEFASIRPEFRWNQLIGLARVSASQYGYPAPGVDEARRLLS